MKLKLVILAAVLCSLRCIQISAEPIKNPDPCTQLRSSPTVSRLPASHIEIDEQAAVEASKHIQKACLLIGRLRDDAAIKVEPGRNSALENLAKQLITILDEIYREHPGLRDTDLTTVQTDKPQTLPAHPLMGHVTASHLRWMLANAESRYLTAFNGVPCREEAICLAEIDLVSEIGFASSPVYRSHPKLWRLERRELENRSKNIEKRSSKSDEAFHKSAPRPGSVKLSQAAISQVRKLTAQIQREVSAGCNFISFSWVQKSSSRGPNDTEWKTSGPGLSLGGYSCDMVPPDVVRTINGLNLVFGGDSAQRFEGKLIDYENGHFVLKEE